MLVDIMNLQVSMGLDVTLLILNDSVDETLLRTVSDKIKIIKLYRKPKSKNIFKILELNKTIYKSKPDIIHLHNSTFPKLLIYPFKAKKVITVHDLNITISGINIIDTVVAISDAVHKDIGSRINKPVVTIPNGINTDMIKSKDFTGQCNLRNRTFRIVQIARLMHEKKGQDILIRSLKKLKEKFNILVDLIGDGPSRCFLEDLVSRLELNDSVRFLGNKSRNEIYASLHEYDLMVHPARYEGFGLTIAESMVAGVPVLVPNEGGPYEIINYGVYGYSFNIIDEDACSNSISNIICNYGNAMNKAAMARDYVKSKYSTRQQVEMYNNLYSSLINGNIS